MKRLLLIAMLLVGACKETVEKPDDGARLRLARRPGGRVAVELNGSAASPRALQLELAIEGGAHVIEDARPPEGVPLDTVRAQAAGAGRARLFAGDKRGILLSRDGEVASFAVRAEGGGSASLRIESARLVDDAGNEIPVDVGSSLVIR